MGVIKFKLNDIDYEGIMLVHNNVHIVKNLFKNYFNYRLDQPFDSRSSSMDALDCYKFTIYDGYNTRQVFHGDLIAWEAGTLDNINEKTSNIVIAQYDKIPFIVIPPALMKIIQKPKKVSESTEEKIKFDSDGNIIW